MSPGAQVPDGTRGSSPLPYSDAPGGDAGAAGVPHLAPQSAALATGAQMSAPPTAAAASHGATRLIVLFMISSIRLWETVFLCAGLHSNLLLTGTSAPLHARAGVPVIQGGE